VPPRGGLNFGENEKMNDLFWRVLTFALSIPAVCDALLWLAKKRPYFPIMKNGAVYMERYWLFNPYKRESHWRRFPSVRMHVIRLPDTDRHLHDLPWVARTLILSGGYWEERFVDRMSPEAGTFTALRWAGDSYRLAPNIFHRIVDITPYHSVVTLFITWGPMHRWGFMVDGKKVYWKDYLGC